MNNLVEQQTSTNFNLMDETGSIGCRMWESEDLPPSEQQKRWRRFGKFSIIYLFFFVFCFFNFLFANREGSYVKVIAGVKSFADQKRLMVQSVQLIEDMNQVFFSFLFFSFLFFSFLFFSFLFFSFLFFSFLFFSFLFFSFLFLFFPFLSLSFFLTLPPRSLTISQTSFSFISNFSMESTNHKPKQ